MDIIDLIPKFVVFGFFSLVFFYIPGFLITRLGKAELKDQEILSLSFCLGIVNFVLVAFLFSVLKVRFLMLPVLILCSALAVYKYRSKLLLPWGIFYKFKMLLLLLIISILMQGFIDFPSGFHYQEGLNFWSAQGHDGLWHVALMEEIKKTLPPVNPIYSGLPLFNYHYLVDVLMGEYGRILPFLSSLDLYFRFFPILFSFMIVTAVFAFVYRWQKSSTVAYWAIFLTTLTGSLGFIITYFREGRFFGGETIFWAAQGNSILGNPPHAVGFSMVPAAFLLLAVYLETGKKELLAIMAFLVAPLAGFKVSAGAVVVAGIAAASLFDLLFNRKIRLFMAGIFIGLSNYLTLKLMTQNAESLLIFLPWWFIRTMVVAPDRLNWIDLELRRQYYLSRHSLRGYLRVGEYEAIAFIIFLVGNTGVRVLGFFEIFRKLVRFKHLIKENLLDIALFAAMFTGFIIPMLFVQKGIIYNLIEFMQYYLLIIGFYSAVVIDRFIVRSRVRLIKAGVVAMVLFFALPTVIGNLVEFYGPGTTPLAQISNEELTALGYLRMNSPADSVILNLPFDNHLKDRFSYQPRPIYAWYSTAYISAISSRDSFLSSEEQALITGYPVSSRLDQMNKFFGGNDLSWDKQFLISNRIGYIYLPKMELDNFLSKHPSSLFLTRSSINQIGLETFFENNQVIIYHFKQVS